MIGKVQYAAITDLEAVAEQIMKLGSGRIAFIFDPKLGWCATDEIEVVPAGGGVPGEAVAACLTLDARVRLYEDWFRPHLANALSHLGSVRFLGESAMEKLFRKPIPAKTSTTAAGGTDGGDSGSSKVEPNAKGKGSSSGSAAKGKK